MKDDAANLYKATESSSGAMNETLGVAGRDLADRS